MINNIQESRHILKWQWKGIKTEMMRKVGADIVVATTEYERIL